MPFLPVPFIGRLIRTVLRDIPRDQLDVAEDQIEWAKKHRMIGDDQEPELARELAPRKVRRALQRMKHTPRPRGRFSWGQHDKAPRELLPPRPPESTEIIVHQRPTDRLPPGD